ncbi:MAG: hypothetical protein K8H88_16885, partial [Sandaracinaceae bacterium]|nr:hypothetical protein [Sandaracinaceae bacterium]
RGRLSPRCIGLAAVLLASACSGPSPEPSDASPSDASDAGPVEPAEVAPAIGPSPPSWTCPTGWIEVPLEGGRSCVPWSERPRCGPGELLSLERGCEPLADDCGIDAPPELSDAMAFVRPGAVDGDGSRARPFGTIAEAVRAGRTELALAPGEHVIEGTYRGLTLIGTCPTSTTLRLSALTVLFSESTIRRARITGPQLVVPRASALLLESVELAGMERAVQVSGTLRARRVAFRDASRAAIIGHNPDAMELEDVSMERTPAALWVGRPLEEPSYEAHATVSLTRVVAVEIGDTAFQGEALASFELSGVVVEDAVAGILASEVQALIVHDAFVRGTAQVGIGVIRSGSCELARAHIEDANGGVHLSGGTFAVEDLVVLASDLPLATSEDARGRAERVFIGGASTYAVEIFGGEAALADLRIDGVEATTSDTGGAVAIESGARVTLERALLTGAEHFGLGVTGGSALDASDLAITDVRAHVDADGYGLVVLDSATLTLARARIERVGTIGLVVEEASARVEDLAVSEVSAPNGVSGLGVHVRANRDGASVPSSLELVRATIRETQREGILAYGTGATLRMSDVVVEGSRAARSAPRARPRPPSPRGRSLRRPSRGSAFAGVLLGQGIGADLTQGRIEDNPFGLIADPSLSFNTEARPGFSIRGIVFRGNEVDHQRTRRDLSPPGPVALF